MTEENAPPPEPPAKKKVDEDWKKRAAEEKSKLTAAKPAEAKAGAGAAAAPAGAEVKGEAAPPAEEAPQRGGRGGPFEMLVTMLAQQASLVLGMVPDPMTGERYQDLGQAKLMIDMLATLRAKTKGNLTPAEDRFLTAALQELQMEFVHLAEQLQAQAAQAQKKQGPRK